MPNWCENTLDIYGEEDEMDRFYEFFGGIELSPPLLTLKDKIVRQLNKVTSKLGFIIISHRTNFDKPVTKFEKNFNFNHILPTPKELENTTSPVRIISQEDYDKTQELYKKHGKKNAWDLFNKDKISKEEQGLMFQDGITQEISDKLKLLFGSDNWYTWRNNNWGTKWDIGEIILNDIDTESCSFNFNTAWSPPEPIIDKLRDMFPKLIFSGMYVGEGYEYADVF